MYTHNQQYTQHKDDLISHIAQRCERLRLLSDIFDHECSDETIDLILSQAQNGLLPPEDSPESALRENLRLLRQQNIPAFATLTRTEYARLFIGPKKVLVPLHESAYRSGVSRMFTQETLQVRAYYQSFGYVLKKKNTEPEDSVGTELEFLKNLSEKCLEVLSATPLTRAGFTEVADLLKAQDEFEQQHMMCWIDQFIDRVLEHDKSGFYRTWATYLRDVIIDEKKTLSTCFELIESFIVSSTADATSVATDDSSMTTDSSVVTAKKSYPSSSTDVS